MSEVTSTYTDGILKSNYNTAKMFLFGNENQKANYNNSTYDTVELPVGTLLGRVSATGLVVPLESGASDGSQFPVGIVRANYSVDAGDTREVVFCVSGEVDQDMIVFQGSDTLSTVVDGMQIRDHLQRVGINLKSVDQLSGFDN